MPPTETPEDELPHKPSFPLGAVLSLVWAALGPIFLVESDHFGPGFLPSIVWLISLPLLTIYLLGMTVYKVDTYIEKDYAGKGAAASMALWPLTLLIYVAIGIYVLAEIF